MSEEESKPTNFIRDIIDEELAAGKHEKIVTRFPPEPNGYLHIGHSKAILTNYSIAQDYQGRFHLRMDDTNPSKEDMSYVDAIIADLKWLGVEWGENLFFASDYYQQLYDWAVVLIKDGKAYVDDLSLEEMKEYRGNLTEPGKESSYRNRSAEENLELFELMKSGDLEDGAKVLRAKIDMAHPNLNMRDPVLYRILHHNHYRTGDAWCIYPMYDFAHGQGDAIEGITHSLCSLEFENHRPLYNWFIENLPVPSHPRQIEFSRLNLTHTVMSKRKLLRLVDEGFVNGWDDPRMPTLSGFRRRGYTSAAIHEFANRAGVTKQSQLIDISLLEFCLRQDLEVKAARRMAVLDPLKVTITNFPEGEVEWYEGPNHPGDESFGKRKVPLTREIYIERDDFMEEAPRKYFRLTVGREVRLRYACYITATEIIKDDEGNIIEILATFDPESRGANTEDGRKVKGTIHFVSATENVPLEVRLYDHLFLNEDPEEGGDFIQNINPDSLQVITAYGEPELKNAQLGDPIQFERKGYFSIDPDSSEETMVFNRTVGLRDSWGKKQQQKKK
ncbi:glutamine--tRNA ligase/YqeY domain fusion protein [Opitutia bacterium ISCC 51]|nr:glutamine--tRNA ligase/YqeY domain fusion protein [Opitutae bacterium ISCC 51]QXD26680.1 glutamine--tRNA ligase/YqeY domain fusion protein [Opitutae bacterium ISCC 52]